MTVPSFLQDPPHRIAGPITRRELVFEKGGPPQVNRIHTSSPQNALPPSGPASGVTTCQELDTGCLSRVRRGDRRVIRDEALQIRSDTGRRQAGIDRGTTSSELAFHFSDLLVCTFPHSPSARNQRQPEWISAPRAERALIRARAKRERGSRSAAVQASRGQRLAQNLGGPGRGLVGIRDVQAARDHERRPPQPVLRVHLGALFDQVLDD